MVGAISNINLTPHQTQPPRVISDRTAKSSRGNGSLASHVSLTPEQESGSKINLSEMTLAGSKKLSPGGLPHPGVNFTPENAPRRLPHVLFRSASLGQIPSQGEKSAPGINSNLNVAFPIIRPAQTSNPVISIPDDNPTAPTKAAQGGSAQGAANQSTKSYLEATSGNSKSGNEISGRIGTNEEIPKLYSRNQSVTRLQQPLNSHWSVNFLTASRNMSKNTTIERCDLWAVRFLQLMNRGLWGATLMSSYTHMKNLGHQL